MTTNELGAALERGRVKSALAAPDKEFYYDKIPKDSR